MTITAKAKEPMRYLLHAFFVVYYFTLYYSYYDFQYNSLLSLLLLTLLLHIITNNYSIFSKTIRYLNSEMEGMQQNGRRARVAR